MVTVVLFRVFTQLPIVS